MISFFVFLLFFFLLLPNFQKTRLLEVGEVPKQHRQNFLSTSNFNLFNTNNLWVNLRAIQRLCASGAMNGDVIVKQTSVDDPMATNHVRYVWFVGWLPGHENFIEVKNFHLENISVFSM